jgi:catechol 2,3-dioxygenase-like lactoylglutathione lyase family enzyme
MNSFPSITHIALTVRDLNVSVPFYTRLFDADPVLDEETGAFRHVVWSLGDTLLGLHQFPNGDNAQPFNERRPGLDHLAFACPSASRTATSSTPPTARDCPSKTPTTCPSRSSPQRAEHTMTIIKPISIRPLST